MAEQTVIEVYLTSGRAVTLETKEVDDPETLHQWLQWALVEYHLLHGKAVPSGALVSIPTDKVDFVAVTQVDLDATESEPTGE